MRDYNNIKSTPCKTENCGCTLYSMVCFDNDRNIIPEGYEGLQCNNCLEIKIRKRNTSKVFYNRAVWKYGMLVADSSGESYKRVSSKFLESIKDEYGFARVVKFDLESGETFNLTYSYSDREGWYILTTEKYLDF